MSRALPGLSSTTVKIVVLVGAMAGTAAQLLAFRQARIVAASELTESVRRRSDSDRVVLALRVQIARRTTPEQIMELLREGPGEDLQHIPLEWSPPPLLPVFSEADASDEEMP
jgi:hypothetical protein